MIPMDLKTSLEEGTCIFFIGAGMSATSGVPLEKEMIVHLGNKLNLNNQYASLSDLVKYNIRAIETIKKEISTLCLQIPREIPTEYRLLALIAKKLKIKIYTTNYDLMLEHVFNVYGVKYNVYKDNEIQYVSDSVPIIKLAGDIHNTNLMKVSQEELRSLSETDAFQNMLNEIEKGSKVVFIGYSLGDREIARSFWSVKKGGGYYYIGNITKIIEDDWKNSKGTNFPQQISRTAQQFFSDLIKEMNFDINVAHIKFDYKHFGGIETYLGHIVKIAEKYEIRGRFKSKYYNIYDMDAVLNLNSISLGFPFIKGASSIKAYEVIAEKKYDVIHAHDFISAYHAQTLGVPVVYTSHSLASKDNQHTLDLFNSHKEIEWMERGYYPLIQNIVTLSDYHKNELPPFSNLHAKKLPLPFYSKYFTSNNISKENAREYLCDNMKINLKNDDFVILYIGRNDYRKGWKFVIPAFKKLKDQYPDDKLKLLLVMPGVKIDNEYIEVKQVQTASGSFIPQKSVMSFNTKYFGSIQTFHVDWDKIQFLSGNAVAIGFDTHFDKIVNAYKSADLVVIPSLYEPMGYVGLEALACGCPIVANRVGGLKEMLQEYATYCDLGDNPYSLSAVEKLYEAIVSAIDYREGRCIIKKEIEDRTARGVKYIEHKFNENQQQDAINSLHNLYLDAIINVAELPIFTLLPKREIEVCKEICDVAFSFYMDNETDVKKIVANAGNLYKDMLYIHAKFNNVNIEKPRKFMEDYGMFWGIAGWILRKKSNVPAIASMGVRALAEAITEITRSRGDKVKSIFEWKSDWKKFVETDSVKLKSIYDNWSFEEKANFLKGGIDQQAERNLDIEMQVNNITTDEQKEVIFDLVKNNMVKIVQQQFMMGASDMDKNSNSDEKPLHKVELSTYYICKFPVTQKEWYTIMEGNTSSCAVEKLNCPMEGINYKQCIEFVSRLNKLAKVVLNASVNVEKYYFDLPTEAQWECAAKCGMNNYTEYSGSNNLLEVGWFRGNSDDMTHPVGELKPNAWGLFDMCGNVQEFCKDIYDKYDIGKEKNPCGVKTEGLKDDHVTRGGSCLSKAACCRTTNRYDRYSDDYSGDYKKGHLFGLRLVLNKDV